MFLHRFFKKILPGQKQEKETTKKQKELLDQYNKGLILQVDNKKNNKEYFHKIKNERM